MENTLTDDYRFGSFFSKISKKLKETNNSNNLVNIIVIIRKLLEDDKYKIVKVKFDNKYFKNRSLKLSLLFQNMVSFDKGEVEEKSILQFWLEALKIDPNLYSNKESLEKNIDNINSSFQNNVRKLNESLIKNIFTDKSSNNNLIPWEFNVSISKEKLEINTPIIKNNEDFYITNSKIENFSDGYQWFFYCLLNFQRFDENSNVIFLFDEIDKSLNAFLQKKMKNFFQAYLKNNTTKIIIYSTHSPFMVNIDDLFYGNRIIYRNEKGETIISMPENSNKGKNLNSIIFSVATQIEAFNCSLLDKTIILLVEGMSDFYFCKFLFKFFDKNDSHILIMPIFGDEFKITNWSILPLLFNVEWENKIALFDDDKNGNDSAKLITSKEDDFKIIKYSLINENEKTLELFCKDFWNTDYKDKKNEFFKRLLTDYSFQDQCIKKTKEVTKEKFQKLLNLIDNKK